ncbi:TPA: PTS transporter subunit EIIC [Clostridium sporogenes]
MSKKNKYENLSNQVVELIGGKENVSFFTHCVTRLRFTLKDKSIVKLHEIEKLNGVIGTQWAGDQFQIVIGQNVGEVYDIICKKIDSEKLDNIMVEEKKKFSLSLLLDVITGCFTPLLPILIGGGMIKVVMLILNTLNLLGTKSGTYVVLNFVSDSAFYFLPVFAGATSAKKFKTNVGLGMLIGAMLIHPSFISAAKAGTALNIFGIPIYSATYSSSIIPAILAVYIMSYVEKFFSKHSPEVIRTISVPLLTILVMIPVSLCLIAPAGAFLGTYFAEGIMWLHGTVGVVGMAILTCFMPFIVMTGMHMALNTVCFQLLSTIKYDPIILPSMLISNLNQGAACAAVALRTKDKNLKSIALSCAITAFGGITEPAMYGITLKYKKAMIGAMIGSAVGGAFAGFFPTICNALAVPGLFLLPAFIGKDGFSSLYAIVASIVIGMIVTFVSTIILYKEDKESVKNKEENYEISR